MGKYFRFLLIVFLITLLTNSCSFTERAVAGCSFGTPIEVKDFDIVGLYFQQGVSVPNRLPIEPNKETNINLIVDNNEIHFLKANGSLEIYKNEKLIETKSFEVPKCSDGGRQALKVAELPAHLIDSKIAVRIKITANDDNSQSLTFPSTGLAKPILRGEQGYDLYVNQVTQNASHSIPLIQGKRTTAYVIPSELINVPWANESPDLKISKEIIHFYAGSKKLGDLILEKNLKLIPSEWVVPNLKVFADVWLSSGNKIRVPKTGYLEPIVEKADPLNVMAVPIILNGVTPDLTEQTKNKFFADTINMLPISKINITIREPFIYNTVTTDTDLTKELFSKIVDLRILDKSPLHYVAFMESARKGFAGLGSRPGPYSVIQLRPKRPNDPVDRYYYGGVVAHELGHNFSLPHAPCGNPAGALETFPYELGSIGVLGFDSLKLVLQHNSDKWEKNPKGFVFDFMSYCHPKWISDYYYEQIRRFRKNLPSDYYQTKASQSSGIGDSWLVSGSIIQDKITLSPIFSFALEKQEIISGDYVLELLDSSENVVKTISFQPQDISEDGDEVYSFSLVIAKTNYLANTVKAFRVRDVNSSIFETRVRKNNLDITTLMNSTPRIEMTDKGSKVFWPRSVFEAAFIIDKKTGSVIAYDETGKVDIPFETGDLTVALSDGALSQRFDLALKDSF